MEALVYYASVFPTLLEKPEVYVIFILGPKKVTKPVCDLDNTLISNDFLFKHISFDVAADSLFSSF